jgi:hypothetical protein
MTGNDLDGQVSIQKHIIASRNQNGSAFLLGILSAFFITGLARVLPTPKASG